MVIKGAIVCDYEREQKNDVRIREGKIVEIQKSILPEKGEEVVLAEGLSLLPAMVDLNVRVANDSLTGKNLATLAKKAAKGGVGSLALMPDCSPSLDNEAAIELLNSYKGELPASIFPIASATKKRGWKAL